MSENTNGPRDDESHRANLGGRGPEGLDPTQQEIVSDAESLLDAYLSNAFGLPGDVAALTSEEYDDEDDDDQPGSPASGSGPDAPIPLQPMNLRALTSYEAEIYWRVLDEWVDWLRRDYGLGTTHIPPLWHRHAELRWELSALHTAWLASYDPEASALAPVAWHRELAESLRRLHDWAGQSGTALTEDRPTKVTLWPGEPRFGKEEAWKDAAEPTPILDRAADFATWLSEDVAARRAVEDRIRSSLPVLGGRTLPGEGA
jgi:hypothetical protein